MGYVEIKRFFKKKNCKLSLIEGWPGNRTKHIHIKYSITHVSHILDSRDRIWFVISSDFCEQIMNYHLTFDTYILKLK